MRGEIPQEPAVRPATIFRFALLAQSVAHFHGKEKVVGSIPTEGSKNTFREPAEPVMVVPVCFDRRGEAGSVELRPPPEICVGRVSLDVESSGSSLGRRCRLPEVERTPGGVAQMVRAFGS